MHTLCFLLHRYTYKRVCLCTCCPDRSLEAAGAVATTSAAPAGRLHPFTNTEAEALILNSGKFHESTPSITLEKVTKLVRQDSARWSVIIVISIPSAVTDGLNLLIDESPEEPHTPKRNKKENAN